MAACLVQEEWLPPRVLALLEAPADLGCRAACGMWARAAYVPLFGKACRGGDQEDRGATQRRPRLYVPHVVVSPASGPDAMQWARHCACLEHLESLRLLSAKCGSSSSSRRLGRSPLRSDSSSDSSFFGGAVQTTIGAMLGKVAGEGDAAWVAWLLNSRPSEAAGGKDAAAWVCLRREPENTWAAVSAVGKRALFGALKASASAGHVEVIRVLLRARADVRGADENDCTALHWAADKGHADACRSLLAGRADVNARDDDEWTSLCLAAEEGHIGVCRTLLEANAAVNLPDEDSRSPLWWAVWKRHDGLVKLLVEHRADLAQTDQNGISPKGLLLSRANRGGGGTPTLSWEQGLGGAWSS